MSTLEGEVIDRGPSAAAEPRQVMRAQDRAEVKAYNPLDHSPVEFKQQLLNRSENYDALALHIRGILVPGKDFGRIHIANKKKCPEPWNCSPERVPGHFSDYTLFATGADKILGLLSLGVHYPNEQDFIRAALTGKQILDVIMKCHILGTREQIVSEGMGACGRDEVSGSLNNCIKRACKRARLDAVLRLPSISALFEDDFLAAVARDAGKNKGNSTTSRQQRSKTGNFNSGAMLQVWPLGGKLEGQRFDEMTDEAIEWILTKIKDKPDVWKAAKRVHDERQAATTTMPPPSTADGPAKASAGRERQGQAAAPPGPVTTDYDDYPEAQR